MSNQPLCGVCGKPLADPAAYVCPLCGEVLVECLARIVDLAPEVETTIVKLAKHGGQPGPGSGERPLPWNDSAVIRSAAIGNTVSTWARHVSESRGIEIPRPKRVVLGPTCRTGIGCKHWSCDRIRFRPATLGVVAAAGWLARQDNVRWLRHRQEGPEAFTALQGAARALEGLVGRPPELQYRGVCLTGVGELDEAGDEILCQAQLYARKGARLVVCRDCGAEHDGDYRRKFLLDQAKDQLLHAEAMARALTAMEIEGVTAGRVRGMARHGRITAHGTDSADRPIYRVSEVLDVMAEQARAEAEKVAKRQAKANAKQERASRAAVA